MPPKKANRITNPERVFDRRGDLRRGKQRTGSRHGGRLLLWGKVLPLPARRGGNEAEWAVGFPIWALRQGSGQLPLQKTGLPAPRHRNCLSLRLAVVHESVMRRYAPARDQAKPVPRLRAL